MEQRLWQEATVQESQPLRQIVGFSSPKARLRRMPAVEGRIAYPVLCRRGITCLPTCPRQQSLRSRWPATIHRMVNPHRQGAHPLSAISTRWTNPPSSVFSSRVKTSLHGRHSAGEVRGSNGRFWGGGPLSSRRGSLPAVAVLASHDHTSESNKPLHRWSARADRMQAEPRPSRG